MKRIIFALCVFIAMVTVVYAGEMYRCIDRNGNPVITSIPQDGMTNCVLQYSYENPSPKEPSIEDKNVIGEKDKPIEKTEETTKALETRIGNCIICCTNKRQACYNYTANDSLCSEDEKNCVVACTSEGNSSSEWSDCWTQSG
jgi:hypothetical protein